MPVADDDYKARRKDALVRKMMGEPQPLVDSLVGGASRNVASSVGRSFAASNIGAKIRKGLEKDFIQVTGPDGFPVSMPMPSFIAKPFWRAMSNPTARKAYTEFEPYLSDPKALVKVAPLLNALAERDTSGLFSEDPIVRLAKHIRGMG